jgi:hypothetical protein
LLAAWRPAWIDLLFEPAYERMHGPRRHVQRVEPRRPRRKDQLAARIPRQRRSVCSESTEQ